MEATRSLRDDHRIILRVLEDASHAHGALRERQRGQFIDPQLVCKDPFFRRHERTLRQHLFQDQTGDDFILEPWLTVQATQSRSVTPLATPALSPLAKASRICRASSA